MLKYRPLLFLLFACSAFLVAGCQEAPTGHKDDTTPGGEPTPPAEELFDPSAFDEYSKQQGNK